MDRLIILGATLLLVTSCSLSKTFHNPSSISGTIGNYNYFLVGDKDTVYVNYDENTASINVSNSLKEKSNRQYTIKNLFFESGSGNRLNAWLMQPLEETPKATILHFHGSAANLIVQHKAIAPLLDKGFQVFTFDYSGYGFSEGKATRKNVLDDAFSALAFARQHPAIEEGKLILYGHSYGGYLASVVGSNSQDQIDGIVIEGAFSRHKAEAQYTIPILGLIVKNEEKADVEIQKNYKPLLVIHSNEDKKVPLKFGKKIFDKANEPKELFEIDKKHISGLQFYAEEIAKKIALMLH